MSWPFDDGDRIRADDKPLKVVIDEDEHGTTFTVGESSLFYFPKTRELSAGEERSRDGLIKAHKRYRDWLAGK